MPGISIFSAPTAGSRPQTILGTRVLKRKRKGQDVHSGEAQLAQDSSIAEYDRPRSVEYAAVVTPAERSQRRLAGWPLNQEPPPLPFPHARPPPKNTREVGDIWDEPVDARGVQTKQSLHSQHLSAMTALLHRCMMTQDYARAGRALGLLLRNEIDGQAVDIRGGGFYGIGAEVLLRQRNNQTAQESSSSSSLNRDKIATVGFEQAKLYYERLMVQYPPHKTWPDAVNALDFCIALFGLWVYVANQESLRLQILGKEEAPTLDSFDQNILEIKHWELNQAKQVAEAMDLRMRDVLFNENAELIRLRAMVALWTADLIERCDELEESNRIVRKSDTNQSEDKFSNQIEHAVVDAHRHLEPRLRTGEASVHRALANSMLVKLQTSDSGRHIFSDA